MDALRAGVTLTLYTTKLVLDLVSATNFCSTEEDPWWCGLTVCFTTLPSVAINVFILYMLHEKQSFVQLYMKVLLYVATCLQVLPIIWLVWAVVVLCKGERKHIEEIKKTILAILLLQCVLECWPQISLQSYVVMKQFQNTFYATISTTEMTTSTTSSIIETTIASVSTISSTYFITTNLTSESTLSAYSTASYREDDIVVIQTDPSKNSYTIQKATELTSPGSILDDGRYIVILVNVGVGLILVTFGISSGASYTTGDEDEDEDEQDEGNIEFVMRILLYLFPFIGVGTRAFICGVLGTYNPGFWFIPGSSALLLSVVCNYIIKKDKTWDERFLDSLFNTTGNFLTKSSVPASFAYFVPATVFFAIYTDNPLCIAAFSLGLICFIINIIVAALAHFLK